MSAFENPALKLVKKQEQLFDEADIQKRYVLNKGLLCFADCLRDILPKSDDKNSMTFAVHSVLNRLESFFNAKELFLCYESKVDENKRQHIDLKYKDFLNDCFKSNVRLYNGIISNYGEKFNPKVLLLEDKDEIEAQYALESSSQPLGISSYELSKIIPENLHGSLPSIEEIESGI